jgi:hypothetical protein
MESTHIDGEPELPAWETSRRSIDAILRNRLQQALPLRATARDTRLQHPADRH